MCIRRQHLCIRRRVISYKPDESKLMLTLQDLERALNDVEPKFGAKSQELKALYRNGFVPYGENFEYLMSTMNRLVEQGMTHLFLTILLNDTTSIPIFSPYQKHTLIFGIFL